MRRTTAALACLGAAAAVAGCSSGDGPDTVAGPARAAEPAATLTEPTTAAPTTPAAEPRTEEAVRAAAKRSYTAYAAGDYEGAFDYFIAADRKIIARKDYAKVLRTCLGSGTGLVPRVTTVRPEGAAYVVTVDVGIGATARTWVYEGGHWRQQASPEAKAHWRSGPAAWLAQIREDGSCTE